MKLRAVVVTAVTALASAHAAQASNVVIDMSQVEDYTQYQTDLQQCEGLAVQNQPDAPQRESVAGTAVKGAAVGAGAVGGKSGSKAAKKGAGVGVIAAAGRNSRNRREASANASAQTDQIVKNCMAGRGYNVLN